MTRDDIISASKADGGMFIVIPSVVKLDGALPLSAQMLYGIITWKCNSHAFTWATNRELGDALGVSPKRVSALLSLLEQQGHIEMELEYRDGTNEIVRRYIYPIMKSSRQLMRVDPLPENEDTPPSERGYLPSKTGIPPPENEEVICNINNNKKNINIPPYSPPVGDKPAPVPAKPKRTRRKKSVPEYCPERFEQFWAVYPGGGSRIRAVAAWDALKPDAALIDEMAAALKRQMRSRQWRDGVGIPHASTWINDRRWTDKLPEQSVALDPGGGWADDPEVVRDG